MVPVQLNGLKFANLKINDWKQFENIDVDFHPHVTVLTGANGSGKTTILNILAKHFGWHVAELATPSKDKKTGFFKFFARRFRRDNDSSDFSVLGEIMYSNGHKSQLKAPPETGAQYQIEINGITGVRGLNIPSHRPVFFYQSVPTIATSKRSREQAYQLAYSSYFNKLYTEGYGVKPSIYYIKETLLNWAIGGNGNEFIEADAELRDNFLGFQNILKQILPRSIGFNSIAIRNYEIVLVTDSGDFMIDAVSGGVSAIIDLGWQIFNYSEAEQFLVVLIDEIENHLHATMQRSILPSLIEAFPNVQFIISTHSPLIVGSVKDSNVYALRYNESNRIYNEKLDLINKARNANEILNEVLVVPFTMPIWVENSLNSIVERYTSSELTEISFKDMRAELKELGLEHLMPTAIEKTLNKKDDKNK